MPPEETAGVVADLDAELGARLRFVLELDRLKSVERRSYVTFAERRENSAEHSWHVALLVLVLAPHAAEPLDLGRAVAIALVHDIVEIDAGDAPVYDDAARAEKEELEVAAAQRLFGLLPPPEGAGLRALWDEYETRATPEARFVAALDRLAPVLLNHATAGRLWGELGVDHGRVHEVNRIIEDGSGELWRATTALLDDAVRSGYLAPSADRS